MTELVANFTLTDNPIEANFNLAQSNIDALFEIKAAGTTWGSIVGNLADQTDLQAALNAKQDIIADLEAIRTGAQNGDFSYSTILTYGDIVTYNAVAFATAAQGALAETALQSITSTNVTTALGYIPYNSSNPSGYITSAALSGYALLSDIPTTAADVGALADTTTINDLTTLAQQNALNSGATTINIGQIATNTVNIAEINTLIPSQATASNQLADKSFVNSSIATNTANFIGTFDSVAELEAYSGSLTNNDYAFVQTTDSAGNTLFDRYKWNGTQWLFEYELNNSSFTAAQWGAVNSGITSSDVALIATAIQPNDNISQLTNNAGFITGINSNDVITALGYTPYNSSNPAGYTSNVGTVTSVNNVSPISGNVTLSIPTDTSDLTNGAGYITGINSSDVVSALGYTPYNSNNPNGYITSSALTGYATETWVGQQGYLTSSAIANMQTTNNLVTSVSSSSTNSQYPSAKLFYDTIGDIESTINTIRGI